MAAKNLRDLVEQQATTRGVPLRKLWTSAFHAIATNELSATSPDGDSIDTLLLPQGVTLRGLVTGALPAVERGSDPASWRWTQTLILEPKRFHAWLKKSFPNRAAPPRRMAGRKKTQADAAAAYIAENYASGIPAGVTNKQIARAVGCHERTIRRARGLA